MKKLFLLFILSISIFACKSEKGTDLDPIIGKWQLFQSLENGIDVSGTCEKRTTIEFKEDGSILVNGYEIDENNNCSNFIENSDWTKHSGTYIIEGEENNIVFENNNNTFYIEDSEIDQSVTYTYKTVFKRI